MKEATAIIMNEAKSSTTGFTLVNLRVYKYESKRTGRQGQGIEYLSGQPGKETQRADSSANSDGETLSKPSPTETPLGEN